MTEYAVVFSDFFAAFSCLFFAFIKGAMVAGLIAYIIKGFIEFLE